MSKATLLTKKDVALNKITEIYGEIPTKPLHLSCAVKSSDESFARGKATLEENELIIDLGDKEITLPFISVIHNENEKAPAIIYLGFDSGVPNKYLPAEEIIDRGYSIFSLRLGDATEFNRDFKSGISSHIARVRKRKFAPGKIAVWTWVAIRMIEYVSSLKNVDKIIIAGHGVAARVALFACGGSDKICHVIANGMMASPLPYIQGLPISGISVSDMPYLYSPSFAESPKGNEYLSLVEFCKGKVILIGAAAEGHSTEIIDEKEMLATTELQVHTSESKIPTDEDIKSSGEIHYHLRHGTDYLSREDWNIYLDCIDQPCG